MVDRSDVDSMKAILESMNRANVDSSDSDIVSENTPSRVPVLSNDVNAMKSILENFYKASGDVVHGMMAETSDMRMQEALMTEETDHGARIGSWEINKRVVRKRNFYDIVRVGETVPIVSDLLIYEAAHRLVRLLNEGKAINSRQAMEILKIEQEYAGAFHDAVLYKQKIVENPKSPRLCIFEDRYEAAKQRALSAKKRLEKPV